MSLNVKEKRAANPGEAPGILKGQSGGKWAATALFVCLAIAPLALLIWFVLTFSVNMTQEDQWGCVKLLNQVMQGSKGWLDVLLIQSNQHLAGIPFLLMLVLAQCTHYNTRAEAIFGIIFPLVSIIAWWRLLRKRSPYALPALLPVVMSICSLRQYESLLGGFLGGLEHIISPTLFLLTVCLLDSVEQINFQFFAAMASGFCCALTLVNGLLVLPLGALQLAASCFLKKLPRRAALALMSCWLGFCAITAAIYLARYRVICGTSGFNIDFIRSHLLLVFQFLLAFLGSPAVTSDRAGLAVIVAAATIVILCAAIITIARKPALFENAMVAPLLLMLFALGSDALILVGRVQLGLNQALTSRYVSIGYLWLAGLYLFFLSARKLPYALRVSSITAVVALMVTGAVAAIPDGLVWGQVSRNHKLTLTNILLNYKLQDESSLSHLLKEPYTEMVRRYAPFLDANGMNVFSRRMPGAVWEPRLKPLSMIDAIVTYAQQYACGQYVYTVDRAEQRYISFNGWAVDPNSRGPVGAVYVCIDDSQDLPAAYGFDRVEIARLLKKNGYSKGGFNASCLSSFLPYGGHSISLKLLSPDGRSYYKTPAEALLLVYDSQGKFWSQAGQTVYRSSLPHEFKRDLKLDDHSFFLPDQAAKISCTGEGLQMELPALPDGDAPARALKMALSVPYACNAQLFYLTRKDNDYSWQRKVSLKLQAGRNTVYTMLPGMIRGALRVKIGERPGVFNLESIEIKDYPNGVRTLK